VNVLNVILKLSQTTILKKQLKNCQPTNPNLNKYREPAKERQRLKEIEHAEKERVHPFEWSR